MKHLAVIPARGGSKRLPSKNKRDFCGKPLICWTIEEAIAAGIYDRVVVSTDDREIAEIALASRAEVPFIRPSHLSGDLIPTIDVLKHAVAEISEKSDWLPDYVHTLQPTSPLRTRQHLREATQLIEADATADSLVSCVKLPHNFYPQELMTLLPSGRLLPETLPTAGLSRAKSQLFARNGAAIYITARRILSENRILGPNLIGFEMSIWESVDIDILEDFRVAEVLMSARDE